MLLQVQNLRSRNMQYSLPHDFLLTFFLFSSIFSASQACNQKDRNYLLSLPFYTSSPSLNRSATDCCSWEGISCDHKGRVTRIWLPSKGLRGSVPPYIGNLTSLSHLNLSHNELSGCLPVRFFSSFNQLKVLDLSNNHLAGDISLLFSSNGSSNGWPSSLRVVDISNNDFNGIIQYWFLQRAQNLDKLNVSHNSFTGSIPDYLCMHSPFVRFLDFSFNHHDGQIPYGLGGCSKLEIFQAGFNSLSGLIPHDIYSATRLEEISLPSNNLTGPISNDIVNLTKLTCLELYDNELSGKLPVDIGKLNRLKHLLLDTNHLTGSLPPSLMNCTDLMTLNLGLNFFDGDISTLNFSRLRQLATLDLWKNNFTGSFPVSLSSWAINILMRCKSLSILLLTKNFLHEALPTEDSIVDPDGFRNLQYLGLARCQLTGQLPIWLSKLKKLEILGLSFNRITGSIPGWLSTLPRLSRINLSNNLILGEIPTELCALPALVSEQALMDNRSLIFSIFAIGNGSLLEFNSLSNMGPKISLENNSLSGNIPLEIGHLKNLNGLNLSHNYFSGNIPDQISELTNLERLDLSANQLSGEIPKSFASLHFLHEFSVANNNLYGEIPSGTQLQSFDVSAYEGNPGLCGAPLPYECAPILHSNKDIQDEDDGPAIRWSHISTILGLITGFLGVIGPLIFNRNWRVVYFEFLENVKNRLCVMLGMCLARFH
ncbi:receptor-like protein 3 [Juglans microcarpa x Juglans regia]|uniref:receptor-like protein 3 n=1 Tax=Juglans microcarpa x Juglans regia TaxID=2249226 RepID=UPI001B7EB992|nr:receptor-like protein 3 [Juglans microcarpa x Juglans regia]